MNIMKIEGVGGTYAKKLQSAGVRTTQGLLSTAADKKGRKELASTTGVPEKLILEWVNLADLMRIKGIGEEYSDLLEEAGVDSVKELRNRRPDNLYEAVVKANDRKRLVRKPPSLSQVKDWVKQAKRIKPVITH